MTTVTHLRVFERNQKPVQPVLQRVHSPHGLQTSHGAMQSMLADKVETVDSRLRDAILTSGLQTTRTRVSKGSHWQKLARVVENDERGMALLCSDDKELVTQAYSP